MELQLSTVSILMRHIMLNIPASNKDKYFHVCGKMIVHYKLYTCQRI